MTNRPTKLKGNGGRTVETLYTLREDQLSGTGPPTAELFYGHRETVTKTHQYHYPDHNGTHTTR